MYGTGTKKMLNLMILNILEKYSDADHCLTQKRIIELLDLEYGMQCDRKSVATNINSLKEMGYDIVRERNGVYLIREFEDWELRLLIDSVLFSQTISRTRAKQLIEKLKTLGNKYFSAKVKHIVNLPELHRSDNTSVALTLDALNDAVSQNRKISFTYNNYGEDFKLHPRRAEPYVVSPYQMVATNGRYYLIANSDKYDDFAHYRVDKMTDVKILQEPARPVKEFAPNGLNLPKHLAEHIYMFSGESVRVKFWIYRNMLDALIDWFGRDFDILQHTDDRILISVRVNLQAMRYWIMQFGEHVEVIEPKTLRDEIRNTANQIRAAHTDTTDTAEEPLALNILDKTDLEETKPKFIVVGAGNFGAMVVEVLNSRSAEELEFFDDVEFVALKNEDLQMSCSEPVYVGNLKFTAWSFDPEIQKRLDEVDLIMIVTDEQNLNSAAAFSAGSRKTKIFITPDASHESSGRNIFIQLDAEHFTENVYKAIRSFRDLLYHNHGIDFARFNADIFDNRAANFAIAFYENNELDLTDKIDFEGAKKILCVATAGSADSFEEIIVQAAFPDAEVRWVVIVDDSLEADTVRAMLVAVKDTAD